MSCKPPLKDLSPSTLNVLPSRLKSSDTQTTTSGSYYGIRSIPTLM